MEQFNPLGSNTYNGTVSSVVSIAIPANANAVILQCYSQNIYVTLDGGTPSATNGFTLFTTDGARLFNVGAGGTVKVLEAASGAKINYQVGRVVEI